MTSAEITSSHAHLHVQATPASGAGPVTWAWAVVGGVLGTVSGLAQANALFAGSPDFLYATLYTFGGMAVGIGIGAAGGFIWERLRRR